MLTLLGALFGLLGSFIPELLKFWKQKEDNRHELEILKIQGQMAKEQHQYRIEEIAANADVASEQAVYKSAEIKYTGIRWIDGIVELWNGIMRPWIATIFVCLYGIVKYAQWQLLKASDVSDWKAITILWTGDDMAIFSTIIAFYFGGRFMKYAMNKYGAYAPKVANGNGLNWNQTPYKPIK